MMGKEGQSDVQQPTERVFLVRHARTAMGVFGRALASVGAVDLGATALRAAIRKAGLDAESVGEVLMGCVLTAGLGQNPARQAALQAGVPHSTPCTTVNKMCASGMKAIMIACQSIMLRQQEVCAAGGMESMSGAPFYLQRKVIPFGGTQVKDGLKEDGLTDAYGNGLMGECAEGVARKFGLSREEQDDYAVQSFERTLRYAEEGGLSSEIESVKVGGADEVAEDEQPRRFDARKMRALKPAFEQKGTVTAGNASAMSDGGAACILASADAVQRLGLAPIAEIIGFCDAAVDPQDFPIAPAYAVQKLLERTGVRREDVRLWEINEAFAVVALANMRQLGLDPARVNVHGGAIAVGHPLGMSGARIVFRLADSLPVGAVGVATACNGGGGASALMLRRL